MQEERAWKGFLLLPRLLHRKCRGGKIAKDKLKERFDLVQSGRWEQLLGSSVAFDEEASIQSTRKRRTQNHGDLEHRVNRALSRVQMGELTAGRQALEGADLAPGTAETRNFAVIASETRQTTGPPTR